MKFKISRPYLWVLTIVVLALIPLLGLSPFHSKGEPREAVVALSMLKYNDWILPINNGGDMPYKPPFMHWCIAIVSLSLGYVTEFTSRLPSALSLIAMLMGGYSFYNKRKNTTLAVLTTLFTLTSFEVHRAGMATRVDMMLTAFVVGALYLFYRWWENGCKGFPFLAVICMTGGVLTKGPVGAILPCLVMGIFFLLRKEPFLRTFLRFVCYGLASLLVPALWYIAAYYRGGDAFLSLMIEENFGRFAGKMSYESHVHPFTYNFMTLITGWLPFSLLVVMSAFVAIKKQHFQQITTSMKAFSLGKHAQKALHWCRYGDPIHVFSFLSFAVILVFYCIPSSKRSTYLLPCYPFMAYFLAQYVVWLFQHHRTVLRCYTFVLTAVSAILTLAFLAIRMQYTPLFLLKGKHKEEMLQTLSLLQNTSLNVVEWFLVFLPLAIALVWFVFYRKIDSKNTLKHYMVVLFVPVFSLFYALEGVYLPTLLTRQNDKDLAQYISIKFKNEPIYSYLQTSMLHFFCTNFYLNDNIKQFEKEFPTHGILMIAQKEATAFKQRHPQYVFTLKSVTTRKRTENKDFIQFYSFYRKHK